MKTKYFLITLVIVLVGTLYILEYYYQNSKVMRYYRAQESTVRAAKTIDSLKRATDSLQYLADSFYNENYPCQIELNRFEIAFRIFTERNPKAAEEYGRIISSETE